jgi:hypothetical protein
MAKPTPGIRHRGASVEAWVWSARDERKIRKTFAGTGALAAAKAWRSDAIGEVRRGALRPPTQRTLRQAGEELIAGMKDGSIRKRDGERYKPSVIRGYATALETASVPISAPAG